MTITVRHASIDDIPIIQSLLEDIWVAEQGVVKPIRPEGTVSVEDWRAFADSYDKYMSAVAGVIPPLHEFVTHKDSGGLVIIAEDDEYPVGMGYGFPGWSGEYGHYHHSHIFGVIASYRDKGVGYKLKMFQRDWALSRGYSKVCWTFQPCESMNASFNLRKLRAYVRSIKFNVYGEMTDSRNAGIPSHRCWVEWDISSQRVAEGPSRKRTTLSDLQHNSAQFILVSEVDGGILIPKRCEFVDNTATVLVEVPSNFQSMRGLKVGMQKDLAGFWAQEAAHALSDCFSRGYVAYDFLYVKKPRPRAFYILDQNTFLD